MLIISPVSTSNQQSIDNRFGLPFTLGRIEPHTTKGMTSHVRIRAGVRNDFLSPLGRGLPGAIERNKAGRNAGGICRGATPQTFSFLLVFWPILVQSSNLRLALDPCLLCRPSHTANAHHFLSMGPGTACDHLARPLAP